jgi:hypothetical protein
MFGVPIYAFIDAIWMFARHVTDGERRKLR